MDSNRVMELTGAEAAQLIASKQISPVELTEAYLERIDKLDSQLSAYITVCREEALAAAKQAEDAVMKGESLGPLHGLPMGVKDQFDTAGVRTTSGSRSLHNNCARPRTPPSSPAQKKPGPFSWARPT